MIGNNMKNFCLFIVIAVITICSVGCGSANSNKLSNESISSASPEEPSTENNAAPLVDYVDVHRNQDSYDGKVIRVAGRITNFSISDYTFYFNDRLGCDEDGIGFSVDLAHDYLSPSAEELYSKGDYVLVEGTYHAGAYASLEDAEVISSDEDACTYAEECLEQWETERKAFAETQPIMNYMNIYANPSEYDGEYLRIIGEITSVGRNVTTWDKFFSFPNLADVGKALNVSLKGCPQEMQDMCSEGQYVILSGKLKYELRSIFFSDCYVESVGEDAAIQAEAVLGIPRDLADLERG